MQTFAKILSVALGGAFGAVARYLINISPLQRFFIKFPFPTFFINILGSFLIGFFLIVLTDKLSVNDNLRFAIMVGFLGAFTTFSTFELEIWGLIEEKFFLTAFLYFLLSVTIGFAGVIAGVSLAKRI